MLLCLHSGKFYLIESKVCGSLTTEHGDRDFDTTGLGVDFLDSLVESHGIKHIVLGPVYDIGSFKYITGYAMTRHLTTNNFRLARGSNRDSEEEFKKALYNADNESLYIMKSEDSDYAYDDCGITWMETGEYIIGIVGAF